MAESKVPYLRFVPVPSTNQTRIWDVESRSKGTALGTIAWWGAWRQYTFQIGESHIASHSVVFNAGCLREIAAFCADQTEAHRGQWAQRAKARAALVT